MKKLTQEDFDAYTRLWTLLTFVGGFILGSFILIWQTIFEQNKEWYVWATAVALMGPGFGRTLAEIVAAFRGGTPGQQ